MNALSRLRLYIAGPMTGYEDFNYPAFFAAADQLRAVGYRVINPADIGVHPGWTREDYLRVGLKRLIDYGQGVALLPLWERSGGAQVETHVARQLGLPVLPLVIWLVRAEQWPSVPSAVFLPPSPQNSANAIIL